MRRPNRIPDHRMGGHPEGSVADVGLTFPPGGLTD
jgi:hypothetical protein